MSATAIKPLIAGPMVFHFKGRDGYWFDQPGLPTTVLLPAQGFADPAVPGRDGPDITWCVWFDTSLRIDYLPSAQVAAWFALAAMIEHCAECRSEPCAKFLLGLENCPRIGGGG
jgi:hypothetical protein